jgi:co-chaperonin GroES (HSP10)
MSKSQSLLDKRRKEWGIPDITFQPMDNNVIVWRLPPLTTSPSGLLHLPEDARSPHIKGVVLAMGPRAMDVLKSNGIEEGHIVVFARFAGWETKDHTAHQKLGSEVLIIKDRDIIGSDELKAELKSGKAKYVKGEDGRHRLERRLLSGKKEKILALAASTSSPAEAETARKIAKGMQ